MKQIYIRFSMLFIVLTMCLNNVWGEETWIRCTSVSDLTSGGIFIIGYEATPKSGIIVPMKNTGTATTTTRGYMYSGASIKANEPTSSVDMDMSKVSDTSPYEVTIAASKTVNGTITIKCGDYYIGNTNTKNDLKLFTSESAYTSFTPSIGENDVFTLKIEANTGKSQNYTTLQYNSTSNGLRYAVYANTQKDVVIYKKNLKSIRISGDLTKSIYKSGEQVDFRGLTATGTFEDNTQKDITSVVTWSSDPTAISSTTNTVNITASCSGVTTQKEYNVTVCLFHETFDTNDGTGGNDDKWNGQIASSTLKSDNEGWTFSDGKGANKCAKFGTGTASGSAQTPEISLTGSAKITFKAAAWDGISESTTLNLSATNGTFTPNSIKLAKGAWTEYTVYLTGVTESTQITFAASQATNNRFFLDEVMIEPSDVEEIACITISSECTDGNKFYSTYSNASSFVVPENLTISEIGINNNGTLNVMPYNTGAIVHAGTGVLVSATVGGVYPVVLSSETGTSVLGVNNCLYASSYGMSELPEGLYYFYRLTMHKGTQIGFWWGAENGGAFSIVANKAYLAVPIGDDTTSTGDSDDDSYAKSHLWFGDTVTSISSPYVETKSDIIYNLSGQRVDKATRGIYIKNGKKYIVK